MQIRKTDLGRMATFLIPANKLHLEVEGGKSAETAIRDFLIEHYGGCTEDPRLSTGWWTADSGTKIADNNRLFTSAFKGKERIGELEIFLAKIARDIGEDCLFLTTGEDAFLIHACEEECDAALRAA